MSAPKRKMREIRALADASAEALVEVVKASRARSVKHAETGPVSSKAESLNPIKEEKFTPKEKDAIRALAKSSSEALVATVMRLREMDEKRTGAKGSGSSHSTLIFHHKSSRTRPTVDTLRGL